MAEISTALSICYVTVIMLFPLAQIPRGRARRRTVILKIMTARIYQILNHYTPRSALDPGFLVLDNSANERPDWFEYWPMRKFLLSEALDEQTLYGFVSPKFGFKTNLAASRVASFIDVAHAATDVVLFSPGIHNNAHYLNVFQHGEAK